MRVVELGERLLVERISALLKNTTVGDDCAVIECGSEFLVVSTDMLHRKTDFPERMSWYQIGWMSAAVNLSDIAAMGAKPVGLLFALGLPESTTVNLVDEMIKGITACADYASCKVIGGDIDSHSELTIVGTALGKVDQANILYRTGTKVGDVVCVTGSLGGAGAALFALTHNMRCPEKIACRLFEPVPRVNEAIIIGKTKMATAMIDISDGLAASLHELSRANNHAGFRISAEKIPVNKDIKQLFSKEEALSLSLYEGGDFELLFTVQKDKVAELRKKVDFTVIGDVIEKGIVLEKTVSTGKVIIECLNDKGYGHIKSS